MTTLSIEAFGLCAHDSAQGDWAFEFAFALARRRQVQLNIFHFLADPFDQSDRTGHDLPLAERARLIIERERALRFRYEDRLGDYLRVGFRVCEESEWRELHRCLTKREFQVLVLPCPRHGSSFGGRPLEQFVEAFVCPTVVVGPESPYTLCLNRPAAHVVDQLGLGPGSWTLVDETMPPVGSCGGVVAPGRRA
jgi:hypothetical protein